MRAVILVVLALASLTAWIFVHLELRRRRRLAAPLVLLDVIVAGLAAVAVFSEGTFTLWMQEDAWAEWATVYAFGGAAVVIGRRLWRWRKTPEFEGLLPRLGLLGVAAFCVFVAGEEISWGQRLLAFKPPEVFLQENFQQELNVHNLLKDKELAGFSLDSRFLVAVIAIGYGWFLPLVRAWKWSGLDKLRPTLDAMAPPIELVWAFGAVAVVELSYPADLAGEACELVLGLLFLLAALMHAGGREPLARGEISGRVPLVAAAPLLLGVVTQPVVMAVVYGPDEELVAQTQDELRMLQTDLIGDAVRPKLRRKRRVHKRLFTAVQVGYFAPDGGEFLEGQSTIALKDADNPRRDRKGYYLDPWNNPYWVLVMRKGRRGVFYSFGPNRRRDTKMPKKRVPEDFAPAGDDIAVVFTLPPAD